MPDEAVVQTGANAPVEAQEAPKTEDKPFNLNDYRKMRSGRAESQPQPEQTQEQSKPSDAPKEQKPEGDESEAESDSADDTQETAEHEAKDDKPPKKRKLVDDIKHQRQRAQTAERERDELRRQLEEAKSKPKEQSEPEKEQPKGKPTPPKLADFQTIDEYESARDKYSEELTDWKLEQLEAARAEQDKKSKAEQAKQQVQDAWNKQVRVAQQKYDDFDEVTTNPELKISNAMFEVIAHSVNGADIAYWLGNNPEESARIAGLPPRMAGFELGQIAYRLNTPVTPEKPVTPRPSSKAPEPINPVGRRQSPAIPAIENMPLKEYRRLRNTGQIR